MNINQFINKGAKQVGQQVNNFKEGAKETGAKSLSALSAMAKTVTPANIRMVERVEQESVDRDLEIIGNAHIVRERVNQISELLGLAPIDVMTEEEAVAYIEAVQAATAQAKKAAKEDEPKNSKLKTFFDNFMVPKEDSNPMESSAKTDSPYPDEDEPTRVLRELEEKLMAQPEPIIIEPEVVVEVEAEVIVEVEAAEPVEEPKKKARRATKAAKKTTKETPKEETPAKRKVAVFDQPNGKYDFEDMA